MMRFFDYGINFNAVKNRSSNSNEINQKISSETEKY